MTAGVDALFTVIPKKKNIWLFDTFFSKNAL